MATDNMPMCHLVRQIYKKNKRHSTIKANNLQKIL